MKKLVFVSFVFLLFAAAMAAETIPAPPESMVLYEGWNLISSPLEDGISNTTITKYCKIKSGPWIYDTSTKEYTKTDRIMPYIGAWVKVEKNCFVPKEDEIEKIEGISLRKGWNIISGSGDFSEMTGCTVTSGPWAYDNAANAYVKENSFDPSKGYWVKVSSECTLKKKAPVPTIPLPDLIVTDIKIIPTPPIATKMPFCLNVTIMNNGETRVWYPNIFIYVDINGKRVYNIRDPRASGWFQAGETQLIDFCKYLDRSLTYNQTGIYTIDAYVDPTNIIIESDDTNNHLLKEFLVT